MRKACGVLSVALFAAAMSAGCATQSPAVMDGGGKRAGKVAMSDISGAIAQSPRMALADNESFLVPIEDDANAPPVYPDALLARRLPPQAVCLRVAIDAQGAVMASAPVVQAPECPAPGEVDVAFFDAVSRVVARWRYDPGLRCIFPDARTRDDTVGSCGGYPEVAEAVSLTYRFMFEQKDGRGSVRMAR